MNLNLKAKKDNTYDAIVVGSGISGGWAAKELCENGLKTLVLERGKNVRHIVDYPTMYKAPWELPYADELTREQIKNYPVQKRTGYTLLQSTKHWFVNDLENPYTEVKRFDWIRGYHVGGRSLMWGRQCYRWSDLDFEGNLKDGVGVDWPIRYKDIEPWYDHVESFIGVSGSREGLPQLPDGKFQPPMEMNCLEDYVAGKINTNFNDRKMIIGRTANLTEPRPGRTKCQYRNLCIRGCPFGAYFSSNSSTIPAAVATGNMTLRPFSIVTDILYDKEKKRAKGVRILDANTMKTEEFYSRIVFVNASTIATAFILLNSTSPEFPEGFGNSSGVVGHNLMDHHSGAGAEGDFDGFEDKYYKGRRPNGIYIPRFRNVKEKRKDYIRGFGYQGGASRDNWRAGIAEMNIGKTLKNNLTHPGIWRMGMGAFGECLPYDTNRVTVNKEVQDKYGLPVPRIDCTFKENELAMRKDMVASAVEMLEAAGLKNVKPFDDIGAPGLSIHEMGTARMGKDPKTSVLNKWNQMHDVPNVFVTDGACMASTACQNPSLTYMALTARACDYAVKEVKKGNL